jgi:hypothetical protein
MAAITVMKVVFATIKNVVPRELTMITGFAVPKDRPISTVPANMNVAPEILMVSVEKQVKFANKEFAAGPMRSTGGASALFHAKLEVPPATMEKLASINCAVTPVRKTLMGLVSTDAVKTIKMDIAMAERNVALVRREAGDVSDLVAAVSLGDSALQVKTA